MRRPLVVLMAAATVFLMAGPAFAAGPDQCEVAIL